MRIIVCVKQILDPSLIEFDVKTRSLTFQHPIPDYLDLVALEQATKLRAIHGGEVFCLSLGEKEVETALRYVLSAGADAAYRIDAEPANLDSAGVGALLSQAAQKIGFDLILCGNKSSDTGNEMVGAYMGEMLKIPYVSRVVGVSVDKPHERWQVTALKKLERGMREQYTCALPAILSVDDGLMEPGYYPILGRSYKAGRAKDIVTFSLTGLEVDTNQLKPQIEALRLTEPKPRTKTGVSVTGLSMAEKLRLMRGGFKEKKKEIIVGNPQKAAQLILEKLREWS